MPEPSGHRRGPPKPGEGFATVCDMLVKMIESQDTETITKLSKTENCIKEMLLHMGTPAVLVPIVDFLGQLEGAKQYCLSDKLSSSSEFAKACSKPYMSFEHCSDPGFLRQQASTHFRDKARAFGDVLDELMSTVQAPESDPTFRFLWDVQISLSTILMCV